MFLDCIMLISNLLQNILCVYQLCLELRNFNAVMAIVVAALGSAPVRRLHKTKEVRLREEETLSV